MTKYLETLDIRKCAMKCATGVQSCKNDVQKRLGNRSVQVCKVCTPKGVHTTLCTLPHFLGYRATLHTSLIREI